MYVFKFLTILFIPKYYKIASFQVMYDSLVHDKKRKNIINENQKQNLIQGEFI